MLDIFKKRRRRFVITGLAGILTLTGVLTGCSDNKGHFAGADGRVRDDRETNVSDGLVTEIGDAVKDKARDAGTVLKGAKDGIKDGLDDVRNNDTTSRVNGTNASSRVNNNTVVHSTAPHTNANSSVR